MRNFSDRIFLIALCLGFFSAGMVAPAARANDCLAEGFYNLSLQGTVDSGQVWGNIGNEFVSWQVWSRWINGRLGSQQIQLNLNSFGSSATISGWIGRTYINWMGTGSGQQLHWSGYQSCIQMSSEQR